MIKQGVYYRNRYHVKEPNRNTGVEEQMTKLILSTECFNRKSN